MNWPSYRFAGPLDACINRVCSLIAHQFACEEKHVQILFLLVIKTKTTNLSDGITVDIEKSYAFFSF